MTVLNQGKYWVVDQLTVQVPADMDDASVCGITDAFTDASPIRTVNVPKSKDGLGLSIKVLL